LVGLGVGLAEGEVQTEAAELAAVLLLDELDALPDLCAELGVDASELAQRHDVDFIAAACIGAGTTATAGGGALGAGGERRHASEGTGSERAPDESAAGERFGHGETSGEGRPT